jgi:hypothetical protein
VRELSGMTKGGKRSLFAGVLRLVPYSGIQYFDITLDADTVAAVTANFIEEVFDTDGGPHRILLPLDSRADETAATAAADASATRLVHPVTGRPIEPARILTITAADALSHLASGWLPLPYLRFVGRDEQQRPRYDSGPTNWVRGWLTAPGSNDASTTLTLAFDTNLERHSRIDAPIYTAPNGDDATFGSTFICVETVDDLGAVLAEPWLETWLAKSLEHGASDQSAGPLQAGEFRHRHIACYLTLLRLLAQSGAMPEARFADTVQRRFPIHSVAVDLIVNIGENETTAILVDATPSDRTREAAGGFAEPLRLRDLSEPSLLHTGAFPTIAEFNAAPFGDAMLSRQSGRHDAFHWPSLVRIGHEARRLSMRDNGAEGVTGLGNLRAFLLDDVASPGVWRQSTDTGNTTEPGPMVSGLMLSHLSEAGALLGADVGQQSDTSLTPPTPAIRPRFSRASMLSFFACELVLHALAQVNVATPDGAADSEVRELREIVVLAPPILDPRERDALITRVNAGVALAWRGLGWDRAAGAGLPKRPAVLSGLGSDVATQVAFLHDEVTTRYQGHFRDLLGVYQVGSSASEQRMRIASAEIGARSTDVTIIDYATHEDALTAAEWAPTIHRAERIPIGTDAIVQALIWATVLPSIERALESAGLKPARQFLDEITGRSTTSLMIEDPYFIRRFNRKVLWPAARGLMALEQHGAASLAHGNRAIALAEAVELGNGRLYGVAGVFDSAALQAGARDFSLAATALPLRRDALATLIAHEVRAVASSVADLIQSESCDLLLLSGSGLHLPSVRATMLAASPLLPSRVIDLTSRPNRSAASALGTDPALISAALLPALAVASERRDILALSGFNARALRRLGRGPASHAGSDTPPARALVTARGGQSASALSAHGPAKTVPGTGA